MTLFAIRDDDLSYWTQPDVIEDLYGKIFQMGGKVSFAVIPHAVQAQRRGLSDQFFMRRNSEKAVGRNKPLVEYMRNLIEKNHAEIMLHGYDHTYAFVDKAGVLRYPYDAGSGTHDIRWVPECEHKSLHRMLDEIDRGKAYLERTFDCSVKVFVPPSNTVAKVVNHLILDLCSATPALLDRGLRRGARIWLTSKVFRLLYGYTYPSPTEIEGHREVTAISLGGLKGEDGILALVRQNFEAGHPAIVATHYWELAQSATMRREFFGSVETLIGSGVKCGFVSEVIGYDGGTSKECT